MLDWQVSTKSKKKKKKERHILVCTGQIYSTLYGDLMFNKYKTKILSYKS